MVSSNRRSPPLVRTGGRIRRTGLIQRRHRRLQQLTIIPDPNHIINLYAPEIIIINNNNEPNHSPPPAPLPSPEPSGQDSIEHPLLIEPIEELNPANDSLTLLHDPLLPNNFIFEDITNNNPSPDPLLSPDSPGYDLIEYPLQIDELNPIDDPLTLLYDSFLPNIFTLENINDNNLSPPPVLPPNSPEYDILEYPLRIRTVEEINSDISWPQLPIISELQIEGAQFNQIHDHSSHVIGIDLSHNSRIFYLNSGLNIEPELSDESTNNLITPDYLPSSTVSSLPALSSNIIEEISDFPMGSSASNEGFRHYIELIFRARALINLTTTTVTIIACIIIASIEGL